MPTTITWRRGSADPLVFQPVQADGTPAPLDGLAMQLRVQAGGEDEERRLRWPSRSAKLVLRLAMDRLSHR